MTLTDFWEIYGVDMSFADFIWQYGKGDPCKAVTEYLQQRPAFLGIVRKGAWKDTFHSEIQYTREQVGAALLSLLELKREEWSAQVQEYKSAEARAKAEEKARREAEALAAAVARVEAEARAKALAEQQAALAALEAEAAPAPSGLDAVSAGEEHNVADEAAVSIEPHAPAIFSAEPGAVESDIAQTTCPEATPSIETRAVAQEPTGCVQTPAPTSFFTVSGAADRATPPPNDLGPSAEYEESKDAEEQSTSSSEESVPSDPSADH